MRRENAKWLILVLTLFMSGQGLAAFAQSCAPLPGKDHRCCLERKAFTAQVKAAPPCRHCFEKAGQTTMPQPVQKQAPVATVLPPANFPFTRNLYPQKEIPFPGSGVSLPQPDIPILFRQILI